MESIDKAKIFDNFVADFRRYFPIMEEHVKTLEFDEHGVFLSELKCYMDDNTVWVFDADKKSIQQIINNVASGYTEDEYCAEVSRRLQKWMRIHKLNQKDIAEATGMTQQRISNYISCRSTMSVYAAREIGSVLGCPAKLFIF